MSRNSQTSFSLLWCNECCCIQWCNGYVQVYFEGTTPLLHVLGGMKTMGMQKTRAYPLLGVITKPAYGVCVLPSVNTKSANLP